MARGWSPVQRAKQPTRQILQVGKPFAQIRIGYAARAVVQLAGDALHRRFGRQAAVDHLGDPFQPTGIGRDQAIGLKHIARCRSVRTAGQAIRHAGNQFIDALLHALRGLVQPRQFGVRIVSQQPDWASTVAVHHDRTDGDPGDQGRAGEYARHRGGDAFLGAVGGADRRQHLGQQHRHRLQLVHLLLRVAPRVAVLHRDHAQSSTGTPHRRCQHGRERFLVGFRSIGEGWMVLRVRQVHDLRRGGTKADNALANAKPGVGRRLWG